jgi:tetratricopeptide (TPR) repeat protein
MARSAAPSAVLQLVHRETILLITLCAVAIVAFFFTRAVAAANRRLDLADAAHWYADGEAKLRSGDFSGAASAFRRASALDRARREYRLALADALSADHHDEAARSVLRQLSELEPDEPGRAATEVPRAPADAASVEELGRIVDEIFKRDPLVAHLSAATRRERARGMLDDLHTQLAACGDTPLANEAAAAAKEAHGQRLSSTDAVRSTIATAARLASRASAACAGQPVPRAAILIARRHGIVIP